MSESKTGSIAPYLKLTLYDAKYRFTWLVHFCHPRVIDQYREHPAYVSFMNKLFNPMTSKSISIDFQTIEPVARQYHIEQTVKKG